MRIAFEQNIERDFLLVDLSHLSTLTCTRVGFDKHGRFDEFFSLAVFGCLGSTSAVATTSSAQAPSDANLLAAP